MKLWLKSLSLLTICSSVTAQYEISSFTSTGRGGATSFVTDYQACGINPANLGWHAEFEDKKFTMGFTEMTYSIHSDALTKDELRTEFRNIIRNQSVEDWTQDEKRMAGQAFANSGLAFNADLGTFGFSYATEKFGGIAFRINDNISMYSQFGEDMSEMLFMGRQSTYFDSLVYLDTNGVQTTIANYDMQDADSLANVVRGIRNIPQRISQIMDGSEIRASWTREYNLSYGRKIFGKDEEFELYAGIGLKYIQGFGMANVIAQDGNLDAFMAITPAFNIDFGTAASNNPSAVSQGPGFMPKAVGNGFGFDFGIDALIKNKIRLAAAVTNIGSMTWDGNVYSMNDTLIAQTDAEGLNSYNVFQSIAQLSGNDGIFSWQGEASRTTKLPSVARFGASVNLGETAHVGFDYIIPFDPDQPASLEKAILGFGGDFSPIPWLRLSAGFLTGGNYDFAIPLGLTIVTNSGSWECGIASRDAITFFAQNGPTISLSTGFARFRF